MALASYYGRAALAASQVLAGFDSKLFQERLEGTVVSIGFDSSVTESPAGLALLDMLVRLIGRLYPAITFESPPGAHAVGSLRELALSLNPKIDLDTASTASI